jgi:hypothetical protein
VDNLFLIADVVHAALGGSETDAANESDLGVSLTDSRCSSMPRQGWATASTSRDAMFSS